MLNPNKLAKRTAVGLESYKTPPSNPTVVNFEKDLMPHIKYLSFLNAQTPSRKRLQELYPR